MINKQVIFDEIDDIINIRNFGVSYDDEEKMIKDIILKIGVDELVNYCQNNNKMIFFKYIPEDLYLTKFKNNTTLFEELLNKNIDFTYVLCDKKIESIEILNLMVKKNRIDLLYKVDLQLLLLPYNIEKSYFDLMLELGRKGIDVHLEKVSFNYKKNGAHLTAIELMKMAKYDVLGFVPIITINMLLYKGDDKKSVLQYLLDMDKNITISKIIMSCKEKNNCELGVILRLLGIDDISIDINNKDGSFIEEYIDKQNQLYDNNCKSNYEDLLEEFANLFYNDGLSEHKIIDVIVSIYRYLTSREDDFSVKELRQLIEIKKSNPKEFIYLKSSLKSYFNIGIYLDYFIVGSINHETTHALHYFLANDYIPSNYFKVIERVKKRPLIKDRIKEYSIRYNIIKRIKLNDIPKEEISNYYDNLYRDEKIIDLSKFLSESKEDMKLNYIDDYHEQVLDTILSKTYSIDEYLKMRKTIEEQEMLIVMMRIDNCAFCSIGDIIDAIYDGKYKNGVLFDDNGLIINNTSGHGISYYSHRYKGFMEMIANYGSIIKSKDCDEVLKYLRWIVGNELVDLLDDVYKNKIVNSNKYINSKGGKR